MDVGCGTFTPLFDNFLFKFCLFLRILWKVKETKNASASRRIYELLNTYTIYINSHFRKQEKKEKD